MGDGTSNKEQQTILRDMLVRQLPHGASTGIDGNEAYTIFQLWWTILRT